MNVLDTGTNQEHSFGCYFTTENLGTDGNIVTSWWYSILRTGKLSHGLLPTRSVSRVMNRRFDSTAANTPVTNNSICLLLPVPIHCYFCKRKCDGMLNEKDVFYQPVTQAYSDKKNLSQVFQPAE